MNEEEIQHMKETAIRGVSNYSDKVWQKAFELHNKSVSPPLPMGCSPCYYKVLNHFLPDHQKIKMKLGIFAKPGTKLKPRPIRKLWGK